MIQFNLLPDVKLEYIRAQRSRRLVMSLSILVTGLALVLLLLSLSVYGLQKKHLSDLNSDIAKESSQLKNEPQIGKILTVQNQLQSLASLHDKKPAVSYLFGYLNEVVPNQVNINDINLDFMAKTITINGGADSLSTINKFVDTLKFTTYTSSVGPSSAATGTPTASLNSSCSPVNTANGSSGTPAFSNIVLNNYGLNSNSGASTSGRPGASYGITLNFDPNIFDITKTVKLSVPNQITTRSCLDKPNDLFTSSSGTISSGTNGGTR